MGYPMDLDEYAEERLHAELIRRRDARLSGRCDYCGCPLDADPPCRFSDHHSRSPSAGVRITDPDLVRRMETGATS